MTTVLWHFSAMDSLFFRDGRPMNVGESAWVDSLFPPTGQTLQGAIRAAILDYLDADIKKFQNGENCLPKGGSLKEEIGDAHTLGNLRLSGPFISRDNQLFFPAPLDLVKNKAGEYGLLRPSDDFVKSDLGLVRFPSIADRGYKTREGSYISQKCLETLLQNKVNNLGAVPLIAESPRKAGLADREPKIGLARDNRKRQHKESMLFAIAPVRPRLGVCLVVEVQGIQDECRPGAGFLQKLGGEGKLAHVKVGGKLTMPGPFIEIDKKTQRLRFKIVCISPVLLEPGRLLPDKETIKTRRQELCDPGSLWQGTLKRCKLEVVTACTGKPHKIGGWNMKEWRPKPLRPFMPAGSVLFCEADADQEEAVWALHNSKIGQETEYGFGHIVIGKWNFTGAQS